VEEHGASFGELQLEAVHFLAYFRIGGNSGATRLIACIHKQFNRRFELLDKLNHANE
jgi:hypothetical protein